MTHSLPISHKMFQLVDITTQYVSRIDHFKVLPRAQNYWGESKMYSECMEKVGRLMLDNLKKADILQFLYITK